MQVIAKLFGAVREAAGAKELSLALSGGATARDVWALLLDEHPRDAPHADSSEDEHRKPDKAEVVLGDREVSAELIFERAPRPHRHALAPIAAADAMRFCS